MRVEIICKLVSRVIQYYVFPIDLWKVGTSWISRKGKILEKGCVCDLDIHQTYTYIYIYIYIYIYASKNEKKNIKNILSYHLYLLYPFNALNCKLDHNWKKIRNVNFHNFYLYFIYIYFFIIFLLCISLKING